VFTRGEIVLVDLGARPGHVQGSAPPPKSPFRPCVVVSDCAVVVDDGYFEVYAVVPLTLGRAGNALCPVVSTPTPKAPSKVSKALVPQVTTVDPVQIRSAVSRLSQADMDAVDHAMRRVLVL
jgi:mRNA-degrading endonuclease toxin of MazEF toxin-antitoxin module